MLEYAWIYDNRQGPEYISYRTQCEVTLQVNEYLLRDGIFQSRGRRRFVELGHFDKHFVKKIPEKEAPQGNIFEYFSSRYS